MISLDEILFDEEPHTYSFRGKRYDSVTQVIRLAGLGDDFSMVPQDRMEYAQRRGRMVHLACQYRDEGTLDLKTVAGEILGYVNAYLKFREECKINVIAVEKKMVNVQLGIAGTPDLICFLNGIRVVIDHKTSQHMSKTMGLQTAGYRMLWNASHPASQIYGRYGLRLEKTGKYKLLPHENPSDESAFFDLVQHARSERRMEKWRAIYA